MITTLQRSDPTQPDITIFPREVNTPNGTDEYQKILISNTTSNTFTIAEDFTDRYTSGFNFNVIADGNYWVLNTPANSYYVWYNLNAASFDPGLVRTLGLQDRIGIEVSVLSADTATSVATKTAAAISLEVDMNATALGDIVTITNTANGDVVDAFDINSFITVSVIQDGSASLPEITDVTVPAATSFFATTNAGAFIVTIDSSYSPVSNTTLITVASITSASNVGYLEYPSDSDTSLQLPGTFVKPYSTEILESILHLMENFASPTQPVNPKVGQLWFDTSAGPGFGELKVFDNGIFVVV